MSDSDCGSGGTGGGFDGGSGMGGGGFDFAGGGSGFDACGPSGPDISSSAFSTPNPFAPGSPAWIQHNTMHGNIAANMHHTGRGSRANMPTGPVGIVFFVIFAIVGLIIFANVASGFEGGPNPDFPPSTVIDGPVPDDAIWTEEPSDL